MSNKYYSLFSLRMVLVLGLQTIVSVFFYVPAHHKGASVLSEKKPHEASYACWREFAEFAEFAEFNKNPLQGSRICCMIVMG